MGAGTTTGGTSAAVILWTDDAPVGYARLVALGAKPVKTPEPWLDHLLIAWVEDPDGHLVQVVQTLNRPVVEPEHDQTSKRNFTASPRLADL